MFKKNIWYYLPAKSEKSSASDQILDKIVKAIPLGYAFLVFCGALYFHFYYNTFHIPIFRYLDLSEIAVSFLPIIVIIFIYMGFILCYFPIIQLFGGNIDPFSKSLKIKKYLIDKNLPTVILCFTCAVYLFLSYEKLGKASDSFQFRHYREYWWWAFLVLSFSLLLFTRGKYIFINLIMIFMTSVVHQSISDVQETVENAKTKVYNIITIDNDTTITNKTFYYVGRTHNYIFLYDHDNASYQDIPLSQIKKITFK